MHILITGATGLIGQEIVRLCHKKKYKVNYLTTSKRKIKNTDNYKGFYWDPEAEQIDLDCLKGVNTIVNLAGVSISKRWTAAYKKEIVNSRVKSIQLLDKALRSVDHKVNMVVSASAIGIYPHSFENNYIEDVVEKDDSFLGDVVEKWERAADILSGNNIVVSKIRIGLVLSERGGVLKEILKPMKFFLGSGFGSGKQWQSWIHIEDLCQLFLFVLENKLSGVYNGVAPNPVTNKNLIRETASIINKPIILPNVPKFVLKMILGEMSYLLLASHKVSSKKIEKAGFNFKYQDLKSALENLIK